MFGRKKHEKGGTHLTQVEGEETQAQKPVTVSESQAPNYKGKVREQKYQDTYVKQEIDAPRTTSESTQDPNYLGTVRGGKTIDEVSQSDSDAPMPTTTSMSDAPNYEGTVRKSKYEVTDVEEAEVTYLSSKSTTPKYPISDGEVDIYAVDTRIWDRIKHYMNLNGGTGGPHDHDDYASKEELDALNAYVEDHINNHPEGGEDPDPPGLTMTYTHRFEFGKDGATWVQSGSGGQANAVLPLVDADGKAFSPETSVGDIRVALDENGTQTADWDNVQTSTDGTKNFVSYTYYYFQDQPQDELFFDIGWSLRPGGGKGLVELQEELENLKKLVVKHSHNYNGRFTE